MQQGKDTNKSKGPSIKKVVFFGVIVILIFFGSFVLWSVLFPLESAAIAPGKVIVASERKTIEHLEGGIIKSILIENGSKVRKGDLLIVLDNTQAKAKLDLLSAQANELLASEARLQAELEGLDAIKWPQRLLDLRQDTNVKKMMLVQQDLFISNKKTLEGQLIILQQRITQLYKEIDSLQAQVKSEDRQLELIEEEITAVAYLEKRKLIEKPRLLALQREKARLTGNRGEHLGQIAKALQKIGETKQQIITLKDQTRKDILKDLREVHTNLTDVLEREKAAEDVLKRTKITAPQSGIVLGLTKHTVGGVIKPGEEILEIIPSQDALVIEAEVNPLDIDVVHPGLKAKVKLIPYKRRKTPTLDGIVKRVSADTYVNDKTNQVYYKARILISLDELSRIKNVTLYPGMPVQVMIITDKRSAFSYFLTPLEDSFERAFKEQ